MQEINLATYIGLGGFPVVAGLTNWAKAWVTDKRLHPVVAVLWGILWNLVVTLALSTVTQQELMRAGLVGFIVGLMVSGLLTGGLAAISYDQVRTIQKKATGDDT